MPRRKQVAHRPRHRVGRSGRQDGAHRLVGEQQFRVAVEDRDGVFERVLVGVEPAAEKRRPGRGAIGGQTGTHGVEEIAELAELVASRRSTTTPNSPWPSRVRPLRMT